MRQRAQSGSRSVPPFSGAPVPQREQVTHRLRHRSQTGVPVAREMPIRLPPADPQMLQARSGPGRQLWQTGPASVIAATRRSFPHFAQGFQLRGSRCQQFWQMGCPPSLRRAVDLTFPHRPQRSARALLVAPAADPQPVDQAAEGPLPAAAGARRLDHGGRACAGKRADEPQDAGEGSAGALAREQVGLVRHGGSDAALPVRPRRRLPQRREDRVLAQRGLQLRHQGEQGADRIAADWPARAGGHCAVPVIRARSGPGSPTPAAPRPPPALAFFLPAPAGCGNGLDEVVHRAVQDVEQRHEDLQAQPLRPLGDQPVDLAGRQRDPAVGQRADQVGGGEHPAVGHHLRRCQR